MASAKPVIHGLDHRSGHSDPVYDTEPIRFDFDNVGHWLEVQTDTTGPDGSGMILSDTSPAVIGITINAATKVEVGAPEVSIGPNYITTSALGLGITPAPGKDLAVALSNTGGGAGVFRIDLGTALAAGCTLRVTGPNGLGGFKTILEVRDDNTFHILTGATWVADL